eukprot:205454-Amphidinium_carterae.1
MKTTVEAEHIHQTWTQSMLSRYPPPNPLLPWQRRDGGETTSSEEDSMNTLRRMIEPEAET